VVAFTKVLDTFFNLFGVVFQLLIGYFFRWVRRFTPTVSYGGIVFYFNFDLTCLNFVAIFLFLGFPYSFTPDSTFYFNIGAFIFWRVYINLNAAFFFFSGSGNSYSTSCIAMSTS
jgi:hypothetical protein